MNEGKSETAVDLQTPQIKTKKYEELVVSDFVHLRLHSEYSIVDSTLRVGDAVAAAAQDGQGALAITDLNNLFAAIKFYKAARGKGIKPLLGADVVVDGSPGQSAGQGAGRSLRAGWTS